MIINAYLGVAGLPDVGYQFFDSAEAASGSRITAGIVNAGDGWYSVNATIPSNSISVRWNSSGSPSIVAREYYRCLGDPLAHDVPDSYPAGSAGKLLADNLDAKVSTRSIYAGTDTSGTTTLLSRVPSALTINGGKVDVNDKTGFSLASAYDPAKTAAQVGSAMTLTSAYDAAKTAAAPGAAMTLTSGERTTLAGVIWSILTSTLTTASSIGKLIVDNLNAAVSSRATQASVDLVKTKTDNLPSAAPGSAGGLFIAGSNANTNVNITGNRTGDLIGNVTGTVHDVEAPETVAAFVRDVSNATPVAGSLGADVKAGIGGGSGGASWDEALPGSYAPGTAGYILGTNLDARVSTRLATSGYTVPPDPATIGVACRDTNNASPAAGSVGAGIKSAASAGDPWGTSLPGAYPAGSAGKIIGDRIDVLVSSRLATASYVAPPTPSIIAEATRDINNQTPAALSLGAAVNAAAAAGDPWQTPLPGPYPSGSAGKLMSDNLDARVSTRLPTASYVVPPTPVQNATATRDIDNTSPPAGSLGDKINNAASAGDPWTTSLPGTYPDGSAGKIIGNNVDAKISIMLPSASYVIPPSTSQIAEAVRDVDNTAPASNSLGEAVNEGGDPLSNPVPGSYAPGTAGKVLGDNLNATVSSRSTYAGTDTPGTTTLLTRVPGNITVTGGKVDVNDKTGFSLTPAYDAAKSASQAGDAMSLTPAERTTLSTAIWSVLTSAMTLAGSIGKHLIDNLDATVGSRLPAASYAAPDNASITAIKAKTDTLPANPASVGDVPTAAQNAAATRDVSNATPVAGSLGADVKSGAFSADPWTVSLPSSYGAGTAGHILGTNLDATVSSRLPTSAITLNSGAVIVGTNNDKTGYSLAAGQENMIADAILRRDWQLVSGEAAYSVLNALRFLRDAWEVKPDGTLVVYKENGQIAWTRTVKADPAAEPIVGVQ